MEIKSLIESSASINANPDFERGYGIAHFLAAYYMAGSASTVSTPAFQIYPNPNSGNIVRIKVSKDQTIQSVKIIDSKGSLIYNEAHQTKKQSQY